MQHVRPDTDGIILTAHQKEQAKLMGIKECLCEPLLAACRKENADKFVSKVSLLTIVLVQIGGIILVGGTIIWSTASANTKRSMEIAYTMTEVSKLTATIETIKDRGNDVSDIKRLMQEMVDKK